MKKAVGVEGVVKGGKRVMLFDVIKKGRSRVAFTPPSLFETRILSLNNNGHRNTVIIGGLILFKRIQVTREHESFGSKYSEPVKR